MPPEEGRIDEVVMENVFYCAEDQIAFTSRLEEMDCKLCHQPAASIGWFESDGGDKTTRYDAFE